MSTKIQNNCTLNLAENQDTKPYWCLIFCAQHKLASSVNLDKFTHFARWAESQALKNIDLWSMATRSF